MSVYTVLNEQDFQQLLSHYNLGQLVGFEGIVAGVENTNYRVTVKHEGEVQSYFLTVFESLESGELSFFLPLLEHLQNKHCLLASPIKRLNGELVIHVQDKPAAFFTCLKGGHAEPIEAHHCNIMGKELARIHLAGSSFEQPRDNPRGFYWLQHQIQHRLDDLNQDEQALALTTLATLKDVRSQWEDLPSGVIHGDLFPDNALFDGDQLSGVIDFYNAANELWVYDLAVTKREKNALPHCLSMAALRFWMSRLITLQQQQGVELTNEIDPSEMRKLLKYLLQTQEAV